MTQKKFGQIWSSNYYYWNIQIDPIMIQYSQPFKASILHAFPNQLALPHDPWNHQVPWSIGCYRWTTSKSSMPWWPRSCRSGCCKTSIDAGGGCKKGARCRRENHQWISMGYTSIRIIYIRWYIIHFIYIYMYAYTWLNDIMASWFLCWSQTHMLFFLNEANEVLSFRINLWGGDFQQWAGDVRVMFCHDE